MEGRIHRLLVLFFLVLLCSLGGIFAAGQVLGLLDAYTPALVFPLSLAAALGLGWITLRSSRSLLEEEGGPGPFPGLSAAGYFAGGLLFTGVLLLPLVLWPDSGINSTLTWDAGLYHLPKAAQLVVSHSLRDLSIAYGEYPSGYELLVAFSFLVSRAGLGIGAVHGLIALLFLLALYLLLVRFSRLPRGLLFFIAVFVLCSYDLLRFLGANPFAPLRITAFTIGKNDFFLAACLLSLLALSPVGPGRYPKRAPLLPGMAVATLLVIGTKPNGVLVSAGIWGLTLVLDQEVWQRQPGAWKAWTRRWLVPVLIVPFGILWAVRNLVLMGRLFSPGTLEIQQYSILNNLANPYLYRYLDLKLLLAAGLTALSLALAFIWKRFHWSIPATLLLLLVSFAVTPASAFFGSVEVPAQIAWRFGLYLLAFLLPVLLLMADPLLSRALLLLPRGLRALLALGLLTTAAAGVLVNRERLQLDPSRRLVLADQYEEPVGTGGYRSAYDFIRRNVQGATVWVENGMPFYVFGPGLTNSISRRHDPDYFVFLRTAWIDAGGYPEMLDGADFEQKWELVYEDPEGRVYRNRLR